MSLNLLPRKEFEITLNSGDTIKGKYGTWAAKRFCDKQNLSIVQFIEKFGEVSKLSFNDIVLLILCSVEYAWRKENRGAFVYSDVDACEWVEELGGFGSEAYNRLFAHFSSDVESTEEKKTEVS